MMADLVDQDVSHHMITLVTRLMAKEPEDRFESFEVLHAILLDLLRQSQAEGAGELAGRYLDTPPAST